MGKRERKFARRLKNRLKKEQARHASEKPVEGRPANYFDTEKNRQYSENKSEKLINIYDPELGEPRLETNSERKDRVLGQHMEVKAKAGMITSLIAREINEMNAEVPITTTSVVEEEAEEEENISLGQTQLQRHPFYGMSQHPLWRKPFKIPIPQTSSPTDWTDVLIADKFGFHADIISEICTKTKHRYYSNTEKVFLATQVNLGLSLENSKKKNYPTVVKEMCKRLEIRVSGVPAKAFQTQLSTNVRRWSEEFSILPLWKGTDPPSKVEIYDANIRKQLREDYELFRNYSFSTQDSAELANILNGTDRRANTINEWGMDGSTIRPTNTEKKDNSMKKTENGIQEQTTPESKSYPTDSKYWVTPKNEPCKDCGHPHCQEQLVNMDATVWKLVLAIKDNTLDWRQLVEEDVRAEVASKMKDEIQATKDEIQELQVQVVQTNVHMLEASERLVSANKETEHLKRLLEEAIMKTTNHTDKEREKEIKGFLT